MPTQLYETMFVIDAGKMSTDGDNIKGALHASLEKFGGEVVVSRPWDDRKLAYPIKKQKKGSFYIIYYNMDSLKQKELDADFRINMTDYLLRHLTTAIDPKLADTILEIAKTETGHAFALRGYHDEAPLDMTPASINDPAMAAGEYGPVPTLDGPPPPPRRPRRSDGPEKPE